MPKQPPIFKAPGAMTEQQRQAAIDRRRGSAASRGYNSKWAAARKDFLFLNPLCAECLKTNLLTSATVVDHIIPHRGDMKVFWDRGNWQALCKICHDRKTATKDSTFARRRVQPENMEGGRGS